MAGSGFLRKDLEQGMEPYDELEGIGSGRQSLDGCMIKAPLALEFIGKDPTDREKWGQNEVS